MLRIIPLRQTSCLLLRINLSASTAPLRHFHQTVPILRKGGLPRKGSIIDNAVWRILSPKRHRRIEEELDRKLKNFSKSVHFRREASCLGINTKLFREISESFVKAVAAGEIPRCTVRNLLSGYTGNDISAYLDKELLQCFLDYAKPFLPEDIVDKVNSLRKISDLRYPTEWYPLARQMQRKIILHVGPTNSGKTYQALQRLESAQSGIYCGPLRLLAHEIYDKMNTKGIPCNLVTGEEKRVVSPYAPLTSSTVEMAPLGRPMDVAVVDEIQLIADPFRGWAWTAALLGLAAKEVHLCGEESAVPLIQRICESLNEELVVNKYQRLTPYKVSNRSLEGDLSRITKGDCVVAFSRRDIFNYKNKIEAITGLKCAVAYGGLPPETRALQAKAFNDPDSGFDVLVASDAVGMGLNLNIKRIIFSTTHKFNGAEMERISFPQLKQIAGRAGRFGTAYGNGIVTSLHPRDLSYIKAAVDSPIVPLETAGLQPTVEMLELFASQMPNQPFSSIIQKIEDFASVTGDYFMCNTKDKKAIADIIEDIPLEIRDRFQFATAPVSIRSEPSMALIKTLAKKFSRQETCDLEEIVELPETPPINPEHLVDLEEKHKQIIVYMWLSVRYPEIFTTEQETAVEIKTRCEKLIDEGLKVSAANKKEHRKRSRAKYSFE
ncbi:ATP-dependent RNA helicase supv3l1, mitochondrial [Rhizopus azygosporus]|uniref:RNA helicase n=1 Tax=Rhizopus azygosporus TaxID=86630 RepID=A0A367K4I1_RHIAZ|nr:ATP-dependent RNA helicase supv3l1, mitochondrial [Rhizopus azygosporus]